MGNAPPCSRYALGVDPPPERVGSENERYVCGCVGGGCPWGILVLKPGEREYGFDDAAERERREDVYGDVDE